MIAVDICYDQAINYCNDEYPGTIYRCDFSDIFYNHCFYIGQTSRPPLERIRGHFKGKTIFDQKVTPCWERSRWRILEKNIPLNVLDERERFYIKEMESYIGFHKGGLNYTLGGQRVPKFKGITVLCPICQHPTYMRYNCGYFYTCTNEECPDIFQIAEFRTEKVLDKFYKMLNIYVGTEEYSDFMQSYLNCEYDWDDVQSKVKLLSKQFKEMDIKTYRAETKTIMDYGDRLMRAKFYDDGNDHGSIIANRRKAQ